MVLHNPNNCILLSSNYSSDVWLTFHIGHWVNKDVSPWAKAYFEENLTQISASENKVTAKIRSLLDVDGDVDVSQRKGKVITLFDVKIKLEFEGRVSHLLCNWGFTDWLDYRSDTRRYERQWNYHYPRSCSWYRRGTVCCMYSPSTWRQSPSSRLVNKKLKFEISVHSESKEKECVKDLVRSKVVPNVRKVLSQFAGDLIKEHGKDIQHDSGAKQAPSATQASVKSASPAPAKPATLVESTQEKFVNTLTLSDTAEFQTTAEELYTTFVDAGRVTAFTRAPPQVFEPKKGGKFKIFGGNVEGEFLELQSPDKIVMKWRLGGWPIGIIKYLRRISCILNWQSITLVQDIFLSLPLYLTKAMIAQIWGTPGRECQLGKRTRQRRTSTNTMSSRLRLPSGTNPTSLPLCDCYFLFFQL